MNTKSIRRKLFTTIIPILLLAIIINSVINILTFRDYYSTALAEKSYTVAQSIRGTISRNLDFFPLESFPGMRTHLGHVLEDNSGISYAFVANDDLQILYHNDAAQVGQILDKSRYSPLHQDDKVTLSLDAYYESIIPIVQDNTVVGTIHVGVEKQLINQRTNSMLFQSMFILVLATAISGYALYYFLSNIVITPLRRLSETVAYISTNKNFDRRVQVEQQDEIGKLATAFNEMIVNLEAHYTALESKTAELRQAQQELEQINQNLAINEKKYRSLFENSKDTIFITTPSGELVDINPACYKLLQYTREELLAMNAIDIYVNPADRSRFRQEMTQHGSVRDFEVKFRQKSGQEIDVLMTATLWQSVDGQVGFQGILRDITTQKQAEQERLKLTAMQRELDVAREIQQNLLPPPKPDWSILDVICYTKPAREVGGDFYAYYAFNHGEEMTNGNSAKSYVTAIGDVSGKGAPAALLMAVSLTLFQATMRQELPPVALLEYLDETLMPYTRQKRQNCALIYSEITAIADEPSNYCMQIANAGCIPPYIKRNNGQVEFDENIGGFALGQGVGLMAGYQSHTVNLSSGDVMILISDGVVEANNNHGDMLGFDRLMAIVRSAPPAHTAEAMLTHLKQAIFAFTGEADQHDDITIVVVRL